MTDKADQDGFDPFREDYPAHEVKTGGELLKNVLQPWQTGDPEKPNPKTVKCDMCHKDFLSKASWFSGKWCYAGICLNCADNNTLPPGFLAECKRAPIRQMSCLRCGITRGVEGTLRDNLWHYELTCSHCGFYTIVMRRLKRACVDCGEEFVVNDKRPRRICHKCDQKKSSGSGAY
jgi:hypothetical protein